MSYFRKHRVHVVVTGTDEVEVNILADHIDLRLTCEGFEVEVETRVGERPPFVGTYGYLNEVRSRDGYGVALVAGLARTIIRQVYGDLVAGELDDIFGLINPDNPEHQVWRDTTTLDEAVTFAQNWQG